MPSAQAILDDIDLRYRNTFTTANKLVWFNEEQRELFDVLELDSAPYTFTTTADENFYPLSSGFDVTKIKVVTYQMEDTDDPNYIEIPFKRNDDNQYSGSSIWYTIIADAFYLHVDDSVPADRNVYIYCDSDPDEHPASHDGVEERPACDVLSPLFSAGPHERAQSRGDSFGDRERAWTSHAQAEDVGLLPEIAG